MHSTSFYVRIAISPDGRYLACGSSGADWQASIWDLHTHSAGTVYGETKNATTALKGHKHEIGGLDWANDIVSDFERIQVEGKETDQGLHFLLARNLW